MEHQRIAARQQGDKRAAAPDEINSPAACAVSLFYTRRAPLSGRTVYESSSARGKLYMKSVRSGKVYHAVGFERIAGDFSNFAACYNFARSTRVVLMNCVY